MDNNLKSSLLNAIAREGKADSNTKVLINTNLDNVLDKSSGLGRIRPSKRGLFKLVFSSPIIANPLEIRCFHCGRVISYPAWYLSLKFSANEMNYFLCYRGTDKPTLQCKG